MKKYNEKVVKVINEAKDLVEKIMRWRKMQLDRILHVKYEPHKSSSQSHFEAVMADVNESRERVEEVFKIQSIAEHISENNLIEGLDNIDLSYDEKVSVEQKKRLKQQKEMHMHMQNKKL